MSDFFKEEGVIDMSFSFGDPLEEILYEEEYAATFTEWLGQLKKW